MTQQNDDTKNPQTDTENENKSNVNTADENELNEEESAEKDPKDLEIENLKAELEKVTETGKRLMADITNLRRRNEEEGIRTVLYANKNLMKNLLPGLDNLKRALLHIPENAGEWGKGIEMSIRQIEKSLEESGLKKMETTGHAFNPELHEAVLQADGEENKILETLEDGYTLGDMVIRHAKVKIGNGKTEEKNN
ncbi:MAG: nucleotide exchange factor GrpE [Candidatus Gracilibacteria bacterium]|jgi:molecular chaperone GrpE|nr:nucleotide exchange factor GrpE [Candidatus Gracilibacteria bacterium]